MKYCCEKMHETVDSWGFCVMDGEDMGLENKGEIYLFGRDGWEERMRFRYCPFCGKKQKYGKEVK